MWIPLVVVIGAVRRFGFGILCEACVVWSTTLMRVDAAAPIVVPYLLLVRHGGIASVRELVALVRQKPGTLNYGSARAGSSSHLTAACVGCLYAQALD